MKTGLKLGGTLKKSPKILKKNEWAKIYKYKLTEISKKLRLREISKKLDLVWITGDFQN